MKEDKKEETRRKRWREEEVAKGMEEGKEEKVEEARWDPEEFHTGFAKNKIKRNYSGHLADFSKAFHPGCSAA